MRQILSVLIERSTPDTIEKKIYLGCLFSYLIFNTLEIAIGGLL